MTNSLDYKKIGLRVGLEVHQQLDTQRKLFCHCPAGVYTSSHDGLVLRHMRPTLSELGEYDGTALMEFKTKKNVVYLLHKSNVCNPADAGRVCCGDGSGESGTVGGCCGRCGRIGPLAVVQAGVDAGRIGQRSRRWRLSGLPIQSS